VDEAPMIFSAEEFVRLRTSERREEYRRAAHEEATLDVWHDIVVRFPDMRRWVAHNKTVPLEILRKLACDEDWRVRRMVASKRKLDRALFEFLSRDEHQAVRTTVAANAKVPRDILDTLCLDAIAFVRDAARRIRDVRFPPAGSIAAIGRQATITVVRDYQELMLRFLSRAASVSEFEQTYLDKFKAETRALDASLYDILQDLFGDVDAYRPGGPLRPDEDPCFNIDEVGLRERVAHAVDRLRALEASFGDLRESSGDT
jgi:hypothetical protein